MITLSCHFFRSDLDMWTASKPNDVGLSLWLSLSMKCVLFPPAFCGSRHVIDLHMLMIYTPRNQLPPFPISRKTWKSCCPCSIWEDFCELPLYVLLNIVSIHSYIGPMVSDCSQGCLGIWWINCFGAWIVGLSITWPTEQRQPFAASLYMRCCASHAHQIWVVFCFFW